MLKQAKMAEQAEWSNLPSDILAQILKRLQTRPDLTRFRSICKSWRSFASPIQTHLHFPLTLAPLYPKSFPVYLHPTLICLISPCSITPFHNPDDKPCLIKVSETENKLTLFNPLEKIKYKLNVPSGVSQKWINLMGFRCFEVGRLYNFKIVIRDILIDWKEIPMFILMKKVAVEVDDDEIFVLGLYCEGQIGLWKLGDEKWKLFEVGFGNEKMNFFDDVVCYNGKFHVVDGQGRLIVVDSATLELTEVIAPIEISDYYQYAYLVESNFGLYMVIRVDVKSMSNFGYTIMAARPLAIKVFVLSEREKRWERVESLGNKVFFVSRGASFSVCAEDLGLKKGNCIYFEGLMGCDGKADINGDSAGVYNMENQDIVTFSSLEDPLASIFCPPSSWFVQA